MKLKKLLLIGLILIPYFSYCQTYIVQIEDRNTTVDLTNQASKLLDENKTDEAVSSLIQAISVDSTYHPSYLMLYKACLYDKGYSEIVIPYLKKGQRIFVEDDELTFYLGEIYRLNSDIKNAILEYSAAINYSKINSEDFELVYKYHFNRGTCFYKMDSIDSAILDYNYSLKLKPDYIPALLNCGVCLFKKGNSAGACTNWTKALELGSDSAKEYIEKYCKNHK